MRVCVRLVPAFELFGLEIGWASDLNAIEIIRDRLEYSIEYRTIMILISKALETVRFRYTSTSKCENEGNEERELERTSDTIVILRSRLKSNIVK